ncbi:hypothetical protein UPYG_G00103470 [Umbra pygmaea]|uniref:Uncharacterized protein n=1 Tax=Umbra pygmaea TaxID=75934 RepID=A0ABD0X2D3_UMBPY
MTDNVAYHDVFRCFVPGSGKKTSFRDLSLRTILQRACFLGWATPVLPGHLEYQVEDFSSTCEEYLEKI